jgi:hypothetical protein
MVEACFGTLTRKPIRRGLFASVKRSVNTFSYGILDLDSRQTRLR